jgi:hypothetical protein
VRFIWVKGHSKNIHNKAVDKFAKYSAKQAFNRELSHVNVRRKKTDKSVIRGSVKMLGQRVTIRIITSEYLNIQKTNKYKYEVMSNQSKYFGNVDYVFTNELLKVGHTYIVSLIQHDKKSLISRVIREILSP